MAVLGEYSTSNGNTLPVLQAGHTIRDGRYDPLPKDILDTGEVYDCVVVGGGISGLAAALFFQRQAAPGMKCLVLENHTMFGGEAKQNEFLVDGKRLVAHQGSAIYQIQYPDSFLAGEPSKAGSVSLVYLKDGRLCRVKAKSAVMAGGSWTTKHIVKDLPEAHREAYAQFYRSPCMMANVAVRNWRFLYKMGMSGCRWFEGIGNYMEVCKKALTGFEEATIDPDSPTVLSLKVLYPYPGLPTKEQGNRGRMQLLSTSFRAYEQQIREQFQQIFSARGFDAKRDIAGIILNRWGHAYLSPQPGFFFGEDGKAAPRQVLREVPFGRIAFANTDLAGAMDHRYSILEAQRAVGQLLDQVLSGRKQ